MFRKNSEQIDSNLLKLNVFGLVSSGVTLTSWGEDASLALVGHPSSDSITIKIPSGIDVLLRQPASHPIFSYWVWLKLNLTLLLDQLRLA